MKMVTVGIRELKQQASELVRMVRETGEEVQVTYRGEVVALLIPVKPAKKSDKAWAKLDNLAAAKLSLRGADSTYIAVAVRLDVPLVTLDVDQARRAGRRVKVLEISR
jgi:prevent-host-death family protein